MAQTTGKKHGSSAGLNGRLGPRFGLEAGFLLAVAVVLGLLEVSWPAIVAAMVIAWLLVAALEVGLARGLLRVAAPSVAEASPVAPPPAVERARLLPRPRPAAEPTPSPDGREWNLWDLERISRERAGANPERDEERAFLLVSMRDFARPDGRLPVEFDVLVREAFGEVLEPVR